MADPMLSATHATAKPATTDAAAPQAGTKAEGNAEAWRAAAEEFEALFLAQMLSTMTQGLGAQGLGGDAGAGGQDVYQDMFTQEVAKLISRTGGIGVADAILQEMLKTQEVA